MVNTCEWWLCKWLFMSIGGTVSNNEKHKQWPAIENWFYLLAVGVEDTGMHQHQSPINRLVIGTEQPGVLTTSRVHMTTAMATCKRPNNSQVSRMYHIQPSAKQAFELAVLTRVFGVISWNIDHFGSRVIAGAFKACWQSSRASSGWSSASCTCARLAQICATATFSGSKSCSKIWRLVCRTFKNHECTAAASARNVQPTQLQWPNTRKPTQTKSVKPGKSSELLKLRPLRKPNKLWL